MHAFVSQPNTFGVKDFAQFRVDRILDNSVTDFDLFLNLENHFILYSGNGYRWNRDELTNLLAHGHESFFIRRDELFKAKMYEQVSKLPQIEKDMAPKERLKSIEQIGAQFTQFLYEGELTEACVQKGEMIGQALVETLMEDKKAIISLTALADHDYYTYFHSIRVASYAVAIAQTMGVSDQKHLEIIALGGIFHDIGKKDVPLSVLNKAGPLTDNEWRTMRSHPTRGATDLKEKITSHIPLEIVSHHHEKRNGAGYPDGLDKNSLIPEVQIATLADIFDALTSSRAYQQARTRYEALDFIKAKLLGSEVCPEAFKALVMSLSD